MNFVRCNNACGYINTHTHSLCLLEIQAHISVDGICFKIGKQKKKLGR